MHSWLLLVYKVPSEPSARRVYVWRKLKRLGAVLLHDAVWVLPANARTRENLQWLAAEINEMQGEALLWESHLSLSGQDEMLIQQFTHMAETEYHALLADLEQAEPDLTAVGWRYQQIKQQDYFQSPLGEEVRESLMAARGGDEG